MKVIESRHARFQVFHIEGEIDLHYAPALRALFQKKIDRRCRTLVLDMTAVPFIDSTGLAVLLEYLRDAAAFGGKLYVAGLSDHVRHVFEIVRLDKALCLFPDVDAAKKAMSSDALPEVPEPLFGPERDDRLAAAA